MVKFDDVSMPESTAPSNSKILLRSTSTAVTTPRNRHIHRWSKFTPWLVLFASASSEDQPSLWIRARQKSWDLLGIYGHVHDSSVDLGIVFFVYPFLNQLPCCRLLRPCSIMFHTDYTHWLWIISNTTNTISGWWYTYPSAKIWVRQLGWWNSQLNGKIKSDPNHQPEYPPFHPCFDTTSTSS